MSGEEGGRDGAERGSWRLTCKAVKQINVPTGEHKTHDIRDRRNTGDLSRESSRTNPMHHPPSRALRAPDPTTDSTTFLTPFPFTCAFKLPSLPLRSNILCSPMRCNGCANFFRDLFFITIPAVSLHFPFRWTVARISISRHSNSTLFFSSRLLPIFYFFSLFLSLFFSTKKINRGRFVSTNLARASSFVSLTSFFFFSPSSPFVARRSLILNCGGIYIYMYV